MPQSLLLFLSLSQANETSAVLEPITDTSRINWTSMRVEATGGSQVVTNAPNYNKAELQSMRLGQTTLQKALYSIDVDSEVDFQDLLNRNDAITRSIQSSASRYEVSDVVYINAETIESTLYIDMHGLLRPYIIERAGIEGRVASPKRSEHSGIIIDARSVEFDPVVLPVIHTSGQENWLSVDDFSKHTAKNRFPFAYALDATSTSVIDKVGSNPALYMASESTFDSLTVHSLGSPLSDSERASIIGNGRVVILLSELP